MRAAEPLTEMMDQYEKVAVVWDKIPGGQLPLRTEASDWEWFEGRLVAIDYSTPAWKSDEASSA